MKTCQTKQFPTNQLCSTSNSKIDQISLFCWVFDFEVKSYSCIWWKVWPDHFPFAIVIIDFAIFWPCVLHLYVIFLSFSTQCCYPFLDSFHYLNNSLLQAKCSPPLLISEKKEQHLSQQSPIVPALPTKLVAKFYFNF